MTDGSNEFDSAELAALYDTHPCNARNVLERLRARGRDLAHLRAGDLAEDVSEEDTDQNHVGGAQFVRDLAQAAGVQRSHRVLDLGCGLGGSARLLADLYGCAVDGLDISPRRTREGNDLTRVVGLEHRVVLRAGDLRSEHIPEAAYDRLWGQAAWVHVRDKRTVFKPWLRALKPKGRVAMEDAYIRMDSVPDRWRAVLDQLCGVWMADIPTLAEWKAVFEPETTVVTAHDLTPEFVEYFKRLLAQTTMAHPGSQREREGWTRAIALADAGVLGYVRMIAEK